MIELLRFASESGWHLFVIVVIVVSVGMAMSEIIQAIRKR